MNSKIEKLKQKLQKPLPGIESHLKMAPKSDGFNYRNFKKTLDAKNSSVLILLKETDFENFQILFTLRSQNLKSHKGQISFPGGRGEKGETPVITALRETEEEVGIKSSSIEIIGGLTELFVPPSNSIVSPVVGLLKDNVNLSINPNEVELAFWIEYIHFLDMNNLYHEERQMGSYKVLVPMWKTNIDQPLWGATAIILSELLDIIQD
jgi:8-oxo-dGTP pyrophosphatase MutT (NUDIX family)